jgi:hypothetical protein
LQSKPTGGPIIWPLVIIIAGILLLLNNFLLIDGFNITSLWPLLLVLAGAQILLRGDFLPSAEAKTFGITRGSVESATLEISAGEIDVQISALQREGRLIAGQFAGNSRPQMGVNETHAYLKMDRSATPWLSFSDWEMGLARDLPWQIFVSSSLGQVQLNLTDLIVQDVVVGTGLGDIRLICPRELFGIVKLRSAAGNIHIVTPRGYATRISLEQTRMFRVHADSRRYQQAEDGAYLALEAEADAPLIEVQVFGTFGEAYLT